MVFPIRNCLKIVHYKLISLTIFLFFAGKTIMKSLKWKLTCFCQPRTNPMTANYLETIFCWDMVIINRSLCAPKNLATLCGLPFKTQLTSNALQYTVHSVRNLSREVSMRKCRHHFARMRKENILTRHHHIQEGFSPYFAYL